MQATSTRRAGRQLSRAEDRADAGAGRGSTARTDRVLPQSGQRLRPWVTAASMLRLSSADAVEALLDGGEAIVDHRLELGVGENVRPVVLDAFTNQFADIEWIDTVVDPFPERFDELGARSFHRRAANSAGEPL